MRLIEPDSKWCIKCKMVLSYDTYNQTLEKQKERDQEIATLKTKLN